MAFFGYLSAKTPAKRERISMGPNWATPKIPSKNADLVIV
jgi:hypothetical protein